MFTGLVESLGTVHSVAPEGPGRLLTLAEAALAPELSIGESVAVNGVCLTVTATLGGRISFQAGPETLRLTNLGELEAGDRVNLERALRLGDRLGGHIVQGHVDGVGVIERRVPEKDWETVWFTCPEQLGRQLIRKGSITVDGVSLTLVDVETTRFSVALIPHTLAMTTLGFKTAGASVNLELDMVGKYVWKYMEQCVVPSRGATAGCHPPQSPTDKPVTT